jgi:hypothetical protein
MKMKNVMTWALVLATVGGGVTSCNIDIPKEVPSSFETMTVEKQDITVPMKDYPFSRYSFAYST